MKKFIILFSVLILIIPAVVTAEINRIDITPMVLVNMSEIPGDAPESRFLGGALAGDFFMSEHFAIRGSVGYLKSKYRKNE